MVIILLGGTFVSAMCGIAGLVFIFYLNFKWGPKLTAFSIPVILIYLITCVWLKDYSQMYAHYILKYVLIYFIGMAIFCKWYFQEDYKRVLLGTTALFTLITMALLAVWMYSPMQFPVSDKVDTVQIQQMSEPVQAVFPGTPEVESLLETLDNVEMHGSFKELTDFSGLEKTYRLTMLKQNGKEISTYYFISEHYIVKKAGNILIFYRWTDNSTFPYKTIVEMYNTVASQQQ